MIRPLHLARPVLLGCALWSSVAVSQDTESAKEAEAPSSTVRTIVMSPAGVTVSPAPSARFFNSFEARNPAAAEQRRQQGEERRAKLRAQLADPKQRTQLVAEITQQQRSANPDLGAVLRLDRVSEDKLIAFFADEQLAGQLRDSPFTAFSAVGETSQDGRPYNPMRDEADRYTQRMREIAKIIGTARLDDFVDYQQSMGYRAQVTALDAQLPAEQKLTLAQRNQLTELFYDQSRRSHVDLIGLRHADAFVLTSSAEERERRLHLSGIAFNERLVAAQAAADRELLERATSFLTPEQTDVLSAWKRQQLDQTREWARTRRREAGLGLDDKLDLLSDEVAPSPPISKNLSLAISLTVNDTQVVKQLTSVRGGSVSFEGPEGLIVEVRPYLDQDYLIAELKLFEKGRSARRTIGQMSGTAQLIDNGKASTYGAGSGSMMVQGRKGYAITWSVSGTYL